MANLLDSIQEKVKDGSRDQPQCNQGTGTTTLPIEGTGEVTEGPYSGLSEHTIYTIHHRFLQTFESKYSGKLERSVDNKIIEDCFEEGCSNEDGGIGEGVNIRIDILGVASKLSGDYYTILHMIPARLRPKPIPNGPDQNEKTRDFISLFCWLVKRFPLLYSMKDDSYPDSPDFLQMAIMTATAKVNKALANKPNPTQARATATRTLLNVFVKDFPVEVAKVLKVADVSIDGENACVDGGETAMNSRVHDLLPLIGFENSELLLKELDSATILATDRAGNTVLHGVMQHETSPSQAGGRALRIVQSLVDNCPDALKKLNSKNLSPYQTRVGYYKAKNPRNEGSAGTRPVEDSDEVALYLKDKYIRYPPEEITSLLYGSALGRELFLNLDRLKNKSVGEDQLVLFLARLNLDTHLKFVRLPQFNITQGRNRQSDDKKAQRGRLGNGRADFGIVFSELKKMGVKKILKIEVEDLKEPSHRDDIIIQSLKDFNIEEWDWRKLDLCTEVIGQAAKDVRQIRLYSSGNNAVLRGWSRKDGLRGFGKLEGVHVTFREGLISKKTLDEYGSNFQRRIDKAWEKEHENKFELILEFPEWDSSSISPQGGTPAGGTGSNEVIKSRWIRDMRIFSNFVNDTLRRYSSKKAVKVAIIDDGIDLLSFETSSKEVGIFGHSFDPDPEGSPWYTPDGEHGTFMANLVRLMCPGSILYVARLGVTSPRHGSESSGPQPTIESAIEAIKWARKEDVDIISMSWTIANPEGKEIIGWKDKFREEIKLAQAQDILLFGTTYNDNEYPASDHPNAIIRIGGADIHGSTIPESKKGRPMFTFPSSALGCPFQQDIHAHTATGSSISTALAAGLAALILYCAGYTHPNEARKKLKEEMAKAFDAMVKDSPYVEPKLFFDPERYKGKKDEFDMIHDAISDLMNAAKLTYSETG